MTGWLGRLLRRPIADGERRRAFLIAAAVLVIAATTLSLVHHSAGPHRHPVSAPIPASPTTATTTTTPAVTAPAAIPTPNGGQLKGRAPAAVMASGRAFLLAYLRFSYGQAPSRFPDAARPLATQLRRFRVDVGPALRTRHLTLLQLRAQPHGRGFEVGALASDGTSTFPIAAIVKRVGGRWLAVRVVTAAAGP